MSRQPSIWPSAVSHLKNTSPEAPVFYFAPSVLQRTARMFVERFDGLVTYAVKANDRREVLENLIAAGVTTFDVASPQEMEALRNVSSSVNMHYNNPVRSPSEIARAVRLGVCSYSVDGLSELKKLFDQVPVGTEISVRVRLPVAGAAYDFGEKFGEDPDHAVALLKAVSLAGYTPAMTFHPGTQCEDPAAWKSYIYACADVARQAGVQLARLNVGGGFAADRGVRPDLNVVFDCIQTAVVDAFGSRSPQLVCEPGRAMVADAFSYAVQVKAVRDCGAVFLTDGIYGAFSEGPLMGLPDRLTTLTSSGEPHSGKLRPRVAYGPTCDSVDRLPDPLHLPDDLREGDHLIFAGMGAYSTATATKFNGYGSFDLVTVQRHDI